METCSFQSIEDVPVSAGPEAMCSSELHHLHSAAQALSKKLLSAKHKVEMGALSLIQLVVPIYKTHLLLMLLPISVTFEQYSRLWLAQTVHKSCQRLQTQSCLTVVTWVLASR